MPLLVLDAPGVSRTTSEKSAVGGTEFSMIERLTIACGSKVWTEAVIGVSALTRVAVTTMSSVLRMPSLSAANAGSASSMAAPPSSAVLIVMVSLSPLPGGPPPPAFRLGSDRYTGVTDV